MSVEIKDRLITILNELEKIEKNNMKKKKKQKKNENPTIENPIIENSNIDYIKEIHIFSKCSQIYLPLNPIPFKVIRIINLGNSFIKLSAKEDEKIYNNFFSPKGSQHIFINSNSSIEIFYVNKDTGEKIWIAK